MHTLGVLMPTKAKKRGGKRPTRKNVVTVRMERVLRAVARAKRMSGKTNDGYTVLLPFSNRLSSDTSDVEIHEIKRLA